MTQHEIIDDLLKIVKLNKDRQLVLYYEKDILTMRIAKCS